MGIDARLLEQLGQQLEDAARDLGDLTAANRRAGAVVVERADIPVRTGRLKARGVTVESGRAGFDIVIGGPGAPYGPAVHARNPFITQALSRQEDAVVDAIVDGLDQALDNIHP